MTELAGIDSAAIEAARLRVKRHFEAGGTLENLGIEPRAPAPGMVFAIVQGVPPLPKYLRKEHAAWRRCSYCETERKFTEGFIVLGADRQLRTLGLHCWKNHGAEQQWHAASAEWRENKRRDRFLLLQGQIGPAAEQLQVEIKHLRDTAGSSITFATSAVWELGQKMPDLAAVLRSVASGSRDLTVERFVRNFAALEGRRGQAASQADGNGPPEFVPRAETIHRISGATVLIGGPRVRSDLDEAFRCICNANVQMRSTAWDKLTPRHFTIGANEFDKLCATAIKALGSAVSYMEAIAVFFGSANLAGIAKWASDGDCDLPGGGRYVSIPRGIRFEPNSGDAVSVVMPRDYAVPDLGSAKLLGELLGVTPRNA